MQSSITTPPIQCPRVPAPGVPFPARRAGFQYARSDQDDGYETNAWGFVASANLQAGDTFLVGRDERITIAAITKKTLRYVDAQHQTHVIKTDSPKEFAFHRRLGDRLSFECLMQKNPFHTEENRELTAIFMRDAAAGVDDRSVYFLSHQVR